LDREKCDRILEQNKTKFLRRDIDHATLTRIKLEGQVERLKEELDIVRANKTEVRFNIYIFRCCWSL